MRGSTDELERSLDALSAARDEDPARRRKRERLVGAATELFVRHGYRKTSVDEIAQAAHVAKGTVYLYFRTKADLLIQALLEEKRHYLERIRPLLDDDLEPRERLKLWLRLVVRLAGEMPLTSRLLSGDREIALVMEEMDTDLREQSLRIRVEFLAGMIDEAAAPHGWSDRELRERANVLIGLFQSAGFFRDETMRNGLPLERFSRILADLLVDGLCAGAVEEGSEAVVASPGGSG